MTELKKSIIENTAIKLSVNQGKLFLMRDNDTLVCKRKTIAAIQQVQVNSMRTEQRNIFYPCCSTCPMFEVKLNNDKAIINLCENRKYEIPISDITEVKQPDKKQEGKLIISK